jgi:hypothetical protein
MGGGDKNYHDGRRCLLCPHQRWINVALLSVRKFEHDQELTSFLQDNLKDADFIIKPIDHYVQTKIIFVVRVPAAAISPTIVHRALSHLMEHKVHANMYLAIIVLKIRPVSEPMSRLVQ